MACPVQVPPKIHLDLYTEDQGGEVQRLIGLGATEVQWDRKPADADYLILADPEGNRFCVIDTNWTPPSDAGAGAGLTRSAMGYL